MDAKKKHYRSAWEYGCFNPRARDGREDYRLHFYAWWDVSIHAPVMDAKPAPREAGKSASSVSIHAPVMDANTKRRWLTIRSPFQSTRPWWTRNCPRYRHGQLSVSIHAPVMDANKLIPSVRIVITFQSTRPWWTRKAMRYNDLDSVVSIHAPVMDANMIYGYELTDKQFQSTRPWWTRIECDGLRPFRCSFNPRARDGREPTRKTGWH